MSSLLVIDLKNYSTMLKAKNVIFIENNKDVIISWTPLTIEPTAL